MHVERRYAKGAPSKAGAEEWRRLRIANGIAESGEDHAKTFRVRCTLVQPVLVSEGEGSSRRSAEQAAAEAVLAAIAAL